ncbi:NMD3 family protein [Besnoitia besnoiti]|uniref:60S ribosomal export protein NMD3 n=1 Tax=Besnoitia besnoiti TaxID=94643 RepID=A0A2A9MCC7_BESBE|nr:NMD3 family protein [Besnoitia besnoiti]PFH34874.1 NMD3 family protein [Besnoitia besnoiti]
MQVAPDRQGGGAALAPACGEASEGTYASVLCCMCGCSIPPSPRSICLSCLAQQVDITEGISRTIVLPNCRTCGRYMHIQNKWLQCDLESRELMALCLKKVRGLKKVEKIVDCQWLWTERHSRRVKLKLTVQSDVLDGRAGLQQSLIIEGVIQSTQCDECKKSFTPHAEWTAMVQVRQHAEHKRTFLFLEQLVLKHRLAARLLNVVEKSDGLDFHFPSRQAALHFADFCQSRFPSVARQAKQLISHDASSNIYYHKYTISVTLASVCKDDLVYVHRKQARSQLGGFPTISLCTRVAGAGIQLTDPFSGRVVNVSPEKYWKAPFLPLCTRKHLTSFLVLDVTPVDRPEYSRLQASRRDPAPRRGKGARSEPQGDEEDEAGMGPDVGREGRSAELDDSMAGGGARGGHGRRKKKRRNSSPSSQGGGEAIWHPARPDTAAAGKGSDSAADRGGKSAAGGAPSVPGVYELELARASDVGVSDRRVVTYSHLGRHLSAGDWVRGYDLRSINLPGAADDELERDVGGAKSRTASAGNPGGRKGRRKGRGRGESDDDADFSTAEILKHQADLRQEEGLAACSRWEVVVVKKIPPQQVLGDGPTGGAREGAGSRVRPWVLQTLRKERDTEGGAGGKKRGGGYRGDDMGMEAEMEAFKEELEEDPEMRAQVNLWKDPRYASSRGKKKQSRQRNKKAQATAAEATHDSKEQRRKALPSEAAGDASAEEDSNDEDAEELACLMEGLTLENGELKGVTVEPGARLEEQADDASRGGKPDGAVSDHMNFEDDGEL